jgi:hypothetical protein
VRFSVDQPIAAPSDRVEEAFVDPRFYEALAAMPNIGEPEVLECAARDGQVHLRVRYAFTGDLAAPARRVLDPATEFRMVPDHYRDRLDCSGSYTLSPDGPARTIQHMDGDLQVHYPVVGRLAERGIVMGLREHVAQEATVLERWISEHS